ncbi:MAG: FixH family protein [Gammaproteobacteria bacterium]|nr:FixH family protein [Gammaproteobacteria bacterium]NIR97944.1 FixH family protein [Gammaproteobacteria bacterium]NIT63645.1 FixH family protein [Gammaproteobacteria bacterium]NIV20585.1 nitrogen fixation protein FixH [Gammaproteobacteria bacterium]NIX11183.1 nitrogen fixation protein FixH [Gammaproteobacteria bacterium]
MTVSGLSSVLPLGVVLVALGYGLLYRFTALNGQHAALVVALAAVALYLPVALLRWPGADVLGMHVAVFLLAAYVLGIIGAQRDSRHLARADRPRKWFHWAPALIVAFFVAVITVDAVFVTLSMEGAPDPLQRRLLPAPAGARNANTVFPGLVHGHFYQKEGAFNEYLERRRAQAERGWRVRKGWLTPRPLAGGAPVLQLAVEDRDGDAVRGAEVRGRFLRPSNSRLDRPFTMDEARPGIYRAAVALPEPGRWQLRLTIRKGEMVHEVRGSTRIYEAAGSP